MQIKETLNASFRWLESTSLKDIVTLADSAGVAFGAPQAFSPKVRSISHDVGGHGASKRVEMPLVGFDGQISGVLCQSAPRSDTRAVLSSSRGPQG